ncbi:MAG: hypothetical protein RIC16_14255 [Rhodospirillales bacterium]
MRCSRIVGVILAAICFTASPAQADQNDPRLDSLFGELLTTEDFVKGMSLTNQIWALWVQSDDPVVSDLMTDGMNAMQVGDLRRAMTAFDEIVEISPDFAEGWNKRATVNYLMGRMNESLTDVERTLELEPRHFGALSGRGLILMEVGEIPQALDAFEHALDTNPHMPLIKEHARQLREALKGSAI